jgi:hypothetical protein
MATAAEPALLAQEIRDGVALPNLGDRLALFESLPVTVRLSQFRIANPDEDGVFSDGDEPYLFVAAIFADGTTIDVSNLRAATVRIQSPAKTHGNLGLSGVGKGTYAIPSAIGTFKTTLKPLSGLANLDLARNLALAGIIVIAMDEDGTPTSAINKAREAFVSILQRDLNKAVRRASEPNIAQLTAKIEDAMVDAIKEDLISSPGGFLSGLPGVVDPDDFIGAGFAMARYPEIRAAGSAGVPISMTFTKSGTRYVVNGKFSTP